MRRAQIIGISVAVGAGALAFIGMRSAMRPASQSVIQTETVDAVQVLVARTDIPLGQIAGEASFRWQDWPRDALNASFVTNTSKPDGLQHFSGAIARAPILAGEPITETKLVKAGSGGVLAAILPAGKRAISTKISEQSAAGKLILPNDRVDVILSQRKHGADGQDQVVSTSLLSDIRVLAIGQQIDVKEGKKNAEGNVATLELTQEDAEQLAWGNSVGEISLALRSILDLNAGESQAEGRRKRLKTANVVNLHKGAKQEAYDCSPQCVRSVSGGKDTP